MGAWARLGNRLQPGVYCIQHPMAEAPDGCHITAEKTGCHVSMNTYPAGLLATGRTPPSLHSSSHYVYRPPPLFPPAIIIMILKSSSPRHNHGLTFQSVSPFETILSCLRRHFLSFPVTKEKHVVSNDSLFI